MGRLYCASATLLIIFFACFSSARWVDDLTVDYTQRLEIAQQLTLENNWEEARNMTKNVYDQWNSQSFPLHVLLRHGDLDEILLCFQSVLQYLEQEDEEPYRANNAQLMIQLKLLAEMEQLTLENVF